MRCECLKQTPFSLRMYASPSFTGALVAVAVVCMMLYHGTEERFNEALQLARSLKHLDTSRNRVSLWLKSTALQYRHRSRGPSRMVRPRKKNPCSRVSANTVHRSKAIGVHQIHPSFLSYPSSQGASASFPKSLYKAGNTFNLVLWRRGSSRGLESRCRTASTGRIRTMRHLQRTTRGA